jgi:flagellar basal body P-ring formation protein FlgA
MRFRITTAALLAMLSCSIATSALARQDPVRVKHAIEEFLEVQVRGLPGEVNYTIGSIDPNNRLTPCSNLTVSTAAGAKSWGRTSVMVRCQEGNGWSIFVPVHIRVVADYLVSATPLAQGQAITAGNLARRRGDLSDLPAGILTDEGEAIGRTAALSISAGRPLRSDMLRQPMVILQNQTVKVVSQGQGFQVTNEGKALTNGLDGQVIRVRLSNGQMITGIARPGGIVEVGF